MRQVVTPLDPDSPEGRAAAEALTLALMSVKANIRRRRAERLAAEAAERERTRSRPGNEHPSALMSLDQTGRTE